MIDRRVTGQSSTCSMNTIPLAALLIEFLAQEIEGFEEQLTLMLQSSSSESGCSALGKQGPRPKRDMALVSIG